MAKYKRINLGHKIKEMPETKKDENRVTYPSFYVSDKKLPLESSNVGKIMNVSAKVKFIGIREENRKGDKSFNYDFEIREITF